MICFSAVIGKCSFHMFLPHFRQFSNVQKLIELCIQYTHGAYNTPMVLRASGFSLFRAFFYQPKIFIPRENYYIYYIYNLLYNFFQTFTFFCQTGRTYALCWNGLRTFYVQSPFNTVLQIVINQASFLAVFKLRQLGR